MSLPEIFVWTRFGTEAGQSIEDIIERKERERRENSGVFLWGIGNNIAPSLPALLSSEQKPIVVFSPIKSKPRAVDENPGQVSVWRRATNRFGVHYDLPPASLVSSRYVHGKSKHFALVCRSDHPLTLSSACETVDFGCLVNAVSGADIGFSQVTAVVKSGGNSTDQERLYNVAMRCELADPFVAVLYDPAVTSDPDEKSLQYAFHSNRQCVAAESVISQLSLQIG